MSRAEIKNLKKAADRIKKAIKSGESIILYGDADLDGVSSVIIAKEAIRNLGGKIACFYFPDREIEGYGVNEEALDYLKKEAPALMVVMDCGIGNFDELKTAKKMGFEVIILDHHKVLNKLPQAKIIVNPKQNGDKYSFKEFAAAGIVFKMAEILLDKKMTPALRKDLLALTAIATIADMMPQEEENLDFIVEGLSALKAPDRPGLRVFLESDLFQENNVGQLVQKIISVSHAGETKNHLNEAYLLLTSTSLEKAREVVEVLMEKSRARRSQIQDIVLEIEEKTDGRSDERIIFEGSSNWPVLTLGPAASKTCVSQKKPVFLYRKKGEYSQGAVRTPKGIDSVQAMIHCSKLLESYGGHPQASGFRIDNKNLETFKTCLVDYFSKL